MKLIRVQYTVTDGFAEQNKENIAAVMRALEAAGSDEVQYFASQSKDDVNTFMHVVIYKGEDQSLPSSLPEFVAFQNELKQNLAVPPDVQEFAVFDSVKALF